MTERIKMKWKFVTKPDGSVSIEADPRWIDHGVSCGYSKSLGGGMKDNYVALDGGLIREEALDELTKPWTEE